MLWTILIASSTFLGYQLLPFAKIGSLGFLPRFFSGWLLGSIGTGYILFFTSIILPFSAFQVLIVVAAQIGGSVYLLKKRNHISKFSIEKNPYFLFLFVFTAGVSLTYLSKIYGVIPNKIPYIMIPFYDDEISFINSVLNGCNRKRSNLLYFSDPRISNNKYHGYSIPLLYVSALMTLGASYSDASIIICFLNTMATCYVVYLISRRYTNWAVMTTLLFLFSGSWASYIYLRFTNRQNFENDLVHQFTPTHSSVFYQTFSTLLSMSKSASFSIAMSNFAVFWSPTILSPIFAALIPSAVTSFATFGLLCGLPHSLSIILPYLVSLLFRFFPFVYFFKPLFREAEMRGTFFAPLIIWFIAFGPVFVVILFFGWIGISSTSASASNYKFGVHFFASIGPFLLLQFFREGTDHFANCVAITATSLPVVMILFVELLKKFSQWPSDEEYRGCAIFIMSATFAFLLYGGYICTSRIVMSADSNPIMAGHDASELVNYIKTKTPSDAVILVKPRKLHPVIQTGRQLFLGDKHLLWGMGVNFMKKLDEFDALTNSSTATRELYQKMGVTFIVEEPMSGFSVKGKDFRTLFQNGKYKITSPR